MEDARVSGVVAVNFGIVELQSIQTKLTLKGTVKIFKEVN